MATLILRTLFYTSCSVACGLSLVPCWAAEYYVSPIGNDTASGTLLEPFASVDRAQQAATAGDTIWIRGGVYEFSGTTESVGILFDKSGQAGSPIQYFAYPGETPVFDFYQLQTAARIKGFSVTASWIHMKGLEVRGVQQILTNVNESWGIRLENGASNNVFEQLNLHHNEGPGFFIADGGNNLVINSDSHHNYDPDRGGENADGFGSHSNDDGNTFIGNRAWYNSDDGFDLINSPGIAYIEDSWAFLNGFVPDTQMAAGNGAGFKAGGFGLDPSRFPTEIPRHRIFGNLAFQNRVQGFYSNHHPGGIDWLNNTAVNNARNFDMLADVGEADHYLRNNLAYGTGGGI
ncbi:MAG: right-handed parallel beta-helix repeat-containing protein, partial [Planctomycetales bacterium]|nr:right-handed parallel beta-helix repeat-containing protein [Planctomycetales bacterium]